MLQHRCRPMALNHAGPERRNFALPFLEVYP